MLKSKLSRSIAPLVGVSAMLVTGSAFASSPTTDDAQAQAGTLMSSTPHYTAPVTASRTVANTQQVRVASSDAQAQAMQVLVGAPAEHDQRQLAILSATKRTPSSARDGLKEDAQAMAGRLLMSGASS